jgi:hypothetical protein
MPSWGWILIAALAVIAVVAVVIAVRSKSESRRTERLMGHYGPEYDRVVEQSGGQSAAEQELVERERERKKLDIVPLSPQSQARYFDQWRMVQTAFVDDPFGAVDDADHLVNQVMRERGYPVDDFDRRAADISVDHPSVVENYRAAHGIYLSQANGRIETESQREAFVYYRALFEKLLDTEQGTPEEARS